MAQHLVPERAAEAEALKTLQHLDPLLEAQAELDAMREEVAAGGAASTQKQAERVAREIAKGEAKVTRLRAELKKQGCKLPADTKELPSTVDELRKLKHELSVAYTKHSTERRILDAHMRRADAVREVANKALDDAVSAAYKTQALAAHPDKRRGAGSTHEDTMQFQRLQTAYATLRDAEMRRAYIDTFDHGAAATLCARLLTRAAQFCSKKQHSSHVSRFALTARHTHCAEKFLGQQAAAAAAAASAESRAPGRKEAGAPLRLGGGTPNRCTCPVVSVVSDSAVMLQWSCSGAYASDVYGYDVQGARLVPGSPAREWRQLAGAAEQATARLLSSGLFAGEWMFRARAVNHAGPGDWSMATEVVLVGDEGAADPEAAARRAADARAVAERRRKEAQDAARNALHRWTHPTARRSPDALDELSRALGAARRAGLPVAPADARLLQAGDDAVAELRASAAQRAAIGQWRPTLRQLSSEAPSDDAAAARFVALVQGLEPAELDAAVRDHCHQLLKKCAGLARERCAGDARSLERVLPLMHAAAERTDIWAPGKIAELAAAAAALQKAIDTAQLVAARAQAAEQRRAAKAERAQAEAAAAKAEAAQQRSAHAEAARAEAARSAAAHVSAAQAKAAAFAPMVVAAPLQRDELDCPICLDTYCSGANKEPHAFGCGHLVCGACLEQLRAAMARHHCPTCREPFDPAARFGIAEEVRDAALRALRRAAAEALPPPQPLPTPKPVLPQPLPTPTPKTAMQQPWAAPPPPEAMPQTPSPQPGGVKSKSKAAKAGAAAPAAAPPTLPTFLSGFSLPPLPAPAPAQASAPLPPLPTDENIAQRFAFLFPT